MQIYSTRQKAHQTIARALLILFVAFASTSSLASLPEEDADGWSLHKESGNIKIYTMKIPSSRFKAAKVSTIVDAPLSNVMAVMVDPISCTRWVHGCTESSGVGEGNFHNRYVYSVNSMPWPVTDRDYVLNIKTRGDQTSGEIVLEMNAVSDIRDKVDGIVRIDHSETLYRLIPEGDKTRLIWLQHVDPNGSLPSSLVNSLMDDIPIKSLQKLDKVANQPRYQNHQLVYNDAGELTDVVPQTD